MKTLVPKHSSFKTNINMSDNPYVYKAGSNSIITLQITGMTNEGRDGVIDDRYAKFRASSAYVVDIEEYKTGRRIEEDSSIRVSSFLYKIGEEVKVEKYNKNINDVCGSGIHYFKTKELAESWYLQFGDTKGIILDGLYREWHESGRLRKCVNYKNGKLNGSYKWWYENGQLEVETTYKDGKIDGPYKRWAKNGEPKK